MRYHFSIIAEQNNITPQRIKGKLNGSEKELACMVNVSSKQKTILRFLGPTSCFGARPISRAVRNRKIAFRSLETLATQATKGLDFRVADTEEQVNNYFRVAIILL